MLCEGCQRLAEVLQLCDPDGVRMQLHAAEDAEVEALCERVGYGAVMDAAYRLWRRKDPVGAHTVGPCVGTVQAVLAEIEGAADGWGEG